MLFISIHFSKEIVFFFLIYLKKNFFATDGAKVEHFSVKQSVKQEGRVGLSRSAFYPPNSLLLLRDSRLSRHHVIASDGRRNVERHRGGGPMESIWWDIVPQSHLTLLLRPLRPAPTFAFRRREVPIFCAYKRVGWCVGAEQSGSTLQKQGEGSFARMPSESTATKCIYFVS